MGYICCKEEPKLEAENFILSLVNEIKIKQINYFEFINILKKFDDNIDYKKTNITNEGSNKKQNSLHNNDKTNICGNKSSFKSNNQKKANYVYNLKTIKFLDNSNLKNSDSNNSLNSSVISDLSFSNKDISNNNDNNDIKKAKYEFNENSKNNKIKLYNIEHYINDNSLYKQNKRNNILKHFLNNKKFSLNKSILYYVIYKYEIIYIYI